MKKLALGGTNVTDLRPLDGLMNLESLELVGTSVEDLKPLSELQSLRYLSVKYTPVNDLAPIAKLTSLRELDIAGTRVSSLAPLSGLISLEELSIMGTPVSNLTEIRTLRSLRSLNANNSKIASIEAIAELNSLVELDLENITGGDLAPLANLPLLQKLSIAGEYVRDLTPLRSLPSLLELRIKHALVRELDVLNENSSLRVLRVEGCLEIEDWQPIHGHPSLEKLTTHGSGPGQLTPSLLESLYGLRELIADRVVGVPPEILSENNYSDCIDSFRSWVKDAQQGEAPDQEVKVFVLGNGTAGKTQICRQLRGEAYDELVPSTHGVQIGHFELLPDTGQGATNAKLWDFGGQDIYHGTHALFLEGRAVFILVWSREVEAAGDYEESGLSMHHHRLTYWLDYVRSLAGEGAAVIVVQAKCDRESDRAPAPLPPEHGFTRPLPQVTCSAKLGEMDELQAAIRSATRYLLEVHGSYRLPASWVAVRDRLRKLKPTHKTITREHFNNLCCETHGTSVPTALLSYLHRSGELFYREGLFKDEIVLDQEWAVRAIYAVLDRNGPCQVLKQLGGIFTLPLLTSLVWRGEFTEEEQKTILGMMESCAICFPLSEPYSQNLKRYALPDLLPLEAEVRPRVEALWRPDLPVEKVTLDYAFLHAGILREFLCQIGKLGGPDAAYWRYGCCFYDIKTHSRARIRAESTGTPESPARGRIVIETCDGNARELLARLQKAIAEIRIGQPPQVVDETGATPRVAAEEAEPKPLAETLQIVPAPTAKPLIYLSYAWGGAKEVLVDHLEARLIREGYDVKRDKRSMRPGDWISDFMREIGQAARVCVVLSEKYVQSPYCMRELLYLYQSSCGDKADFLNRIVPLVLEDAKLSKTPDRLAHVRYWNDQLKELKEATKDLDPATWGGAVADMTMIQDFCHHTELMLRHVSDHLMPRGITDIEKDDFAAVLAALKAKA
jgi:internalin A